VLPITLSSAQRTLVELPVNTRVFLEGPAGSGKTTVGVERMLWLMAQGVPGATILLLLPQRTLGTPYQEALNYPGVVGGGMVSLLTVGGLSQRMVDLFWPLAGHAAGFANPDQPPVFLTLETAQYAMAHVLRPLLDESLLESLSMDRNRLYSQIIDNLNKAALVGFPYQEIGDRLKAAWVGDPGQMRIYDQAQICATHFRQYCLEHNLLDFSLQVEVFWRYLWPHPLCRQHLSTTYRHLIFDNLEEDTPLAHDFLREWLPDLDSALLIYDQDAGYRLFLGADPQGAYALKDLCAEQVVFEGSFVQAKAVSELETRLTATLSPNPSPIKHRASSLEKEGQGEGAIAFSNYRYLPQVLDWIADKIVALVENEGTPPSEIVVLAPLLSDALRFSLMDRLSARNIPVRSHRPSRSLREEPASQCLVTLAALAFPQWQLRPSRFDLAYALLQAIQDADLIRAQLLAQIVYRLNEGIPSLSSFDLILPEKQDRITYKLGERYELLRLWLQEFVQGEPEELDIFWSRLFGEVLSQEGFGFYSNWNAAEVAANLIESAQKFRWAVGPALQEEGQVVGKEYLTMLQEGVIAAQYLQSWQPAPDEAVLIAPAYTYLLSNRPAAYQFWLDAGSPAWAERLNQPLTHPYVLNRNWPADRVWTDADEVKANQETLYRLTVGLLRRCRNQIFLGLNEINEQGYEQHGPLLRAIQRALRS
jgi:hypothetical protein